MRIQLKLILVLLALSLPVLVLTNIIFYTSEKKAVTHNILNHLESVASIQQHRLHDIAEQNAERLRLVASRTQLRISLEEFLTSSDERHLKKINKILLDAQESLPDFKHIYVYSPDGIIIASSNPSKIEEEIEHGHKDVFTAGRQGNKIDLFFLDKYKNLSLHLTGPLYLKNKFLGVLSIDTKVDNMVSAISDYTGLGQTGEIILATKDQNNDTVFIMPTRFDRQAALRLIIPRDDKKIPINLAFSGKDAVLTDAIDYRRVPVLAATRYIEGVNWGIVVKIDKAEAFAPLSRLNVLFFGILAGAVCLIIFLSFYFAKSITKPIASLTEVAHDIAGDNFKKQAEESSKDEIGALAAAFNQMTGKLINTRKILEKNINELQSANQQLQVEKEQLAVTLRSIGDGVITTDISGNIVLLNKVAENLTGWSNEEATGRPLDEVFHIINEKTREVCENPITKVINSGQIIGLANHTILLAKNGEEYCIADSGAPIFDARSKIIGVVLVFRDVTEKQRLEQEALKVRKLESVGVLAGGIAHDFNNILAAILGNINLALDQTDPHESIYTLLSQAEKASLRAKNLTQQLLTFSKGGEPVRKTTSISEIILDSSSFVLRGSNIRCDTEFEPDLLPVDIDAGQISQVIQNIIINAAHAMPQGGVINIQCKNLLEHHPKPASLNGDRHIVITIKDNGVGIPDNIIDKIFDPYFSTKQTGSGLGLAICHSIITRHGGCIIVKSKPGNGAEFSIYLIASTDQISDSPIKETSPATQGHEKIMIMDDDEMVREMVKAMLIRLGYEIELAVDGEETIEIYEKAFSTGTQAALIIMDLTIPGGMGGKDAVKKILNINPKAKIIVSSGYSNDPVMANYTDYGFCGSIVKPYQMKELNRAIQKVLE